VILVAYGAQVLFCGADSVASWSRLNRILMLLAVAFTVVLAIPFIFVTPDMRVWTESSLFFIILVYPLFRYVSGGGRGAAGRFLVVAFIVFDLHSFSTIAFNKIEVARAGADQYERLVSMRSAADFLKSLPGPFRVQVVGEPASTFGDAYRIQTLNGGAVTLAANYMELMSRGGPGIDLLNVRYFLKPASAVDPNPVYADANWKIYANPSAYPRAWIEPGMAPSTVEQYSARHIAVKANAPAAGILVLSELYYPGWEARVNGRLVRITEVHGGLRGIAVPRGESRVTVDYAPRSVMLGAILTLLTFALTLLAAARWLRPVAIDLQ